MELEINKKDSKANITTLKKSKYSIQRKVSGILLTVMLFSGVGMNVQAYEAQPSITTEIENTFAEADDSLVVEIPDDYKYNIASACGKDKSEDITVGDLRKIQPMYFLIQEDKNKDLSWINYCESLDSLQLITNSDDLSHLSEIKGLPSLKSATLCSNNDNDLELNNANFGFLKNCPNLESLSLWNVSTEPGFLESLTNLKSLTLTPNKNTIIDYSKMTFLKEIDIGQTENVYTIAISFSNEDIKILKDAGVKIIFDNQENLDKLIDVNNKLDEIVSNLGVTKESSDQEKLDAILVYVLDKLEYDEGVSKALKENTEHEDLTKSFYQDGYLFGALEKDSSICGNYTALVQALAHRLDLNSYYLTSNTHAWNLVQIDDDYYYVDSTWLDGYYNYKEVKINDNTSTYETVSAQDEIRDKNTDNLEWYMANPEAYPKNESRSESHNAKNFPTFVNLTPKEAEDEIIIEETSVIEDINDFDKETQDMDKKATKISSKDKFEVSFKGKKWIIGGAAAIGLITALGGAVVISSNQKRRRRSIYNNLDSWNPGYSSYSDPFADIYGSSGKRM